MIIIIIIIIMIIIIIIIIITTTTTTTIIIIIIIIFNNILLFTFTNKLFLHSPDLRQSSRKRGEQPDVLEELVLDLRSYPCLERRGWRKHSALDDLAGTPCGKHPGVSIQSLLKLLLA